MTDERCRHCNGELPDPPGAVCPNCGRRLKPFFDTWQGKVAVVVVALGLAIGFLAWRQSVNSDKAKRDVNSYIECLNNGGDNTTCTQLGK